jgi:hypothetical protein
MDWRGLEFPKKRFAALMQEDAPTLTQQVCSNDQFFAALGGKLPAALGMERDELLRILNQPT